MTRHFNTIELKAAPTTQIILTALRFRYLNGVKILNRRPPNGDGKGGKPRCAAGAAQSRAARRSERGGRDEAPIVEGAIPRELKGSLYRNGPGLYERGGLRKPHLLDGDGLVQRLSFADGAAHYQNAFVRTEKFVAEEKADAFRFSTWSMRRPGGLLANLGGGSVHSQAGVTVYPFQDILYVFYEVDRPYGVDPRTLETLGERIVGDPCRDGSLSTSASARAGRSGSGRPSPGRKCWWCGRSRGKRSPAA